MFKVNLKFILTIPQKIANLYGNWQLFGNSISSKLQQKCIRYYLFSHYLEHTDAYRFKAMQLFSYVFCVILLVLTVSENNFGLANYFARSKQLPS